MRWARCRCSRFVRWYRRSPVALLLCPCRERIALTPPPLARHPGSPAEHKGESPVKRLFFAMPFALLLAIAGAAAPVTAPIASAAPCVVIYLVYFDSPWSDTGSNTSLNAEWIKLHNRCSTNKSLTSWRIKDKAGHRYVFGTYALKAGAYVTVH